MPTDHIVSLLIAERDKLNRAIEALQGEVKRRGRPLKKPVAMETGTPVTAAPAPKKKRHVSAAARKKVADAQRRRWAAIKGEK